MSAIVVNHNGGSYLVDCVRDLWVAQRDMSLETIVVDNGSTDDSLDRVREADLPVRVIRNLRNVGFGPANNIGAAAARGRYLLLVNTDCFVADNLPRKLARRLDALPPAAVVGPRLLNPDGTLQPSCHNFPTPLIFFLEQSQLWRVLRRVPAVARRLQIAAPHIRPARVDWLSGACLMIRREAFEAVGGFDPAFFFYWEETDLCRRLHAAGWDVVFAPEATAVHVGGGSSSPALLPEYFRGLYRFYRKYRGPWPLFAVRAIVRAMALFKAARATARAWSRQERATALAERDSWLRVFWL